MRGHPSRSLTEDMGINGTKHDMYLTELRDNLTPNPGGEDDNSDRGRSDCTALKTVRLTLCSTVLWEDECNANMALRVR